MENLEKIAQEISISLDEHTKVRDNALSTSRSLTRHCANTIRAVHRQDWDAADKELNAAQGLVDQIHTELTDFPNLYFAGYTQDAIKEFAEASIFYSLMKTDTLPSHTDLRIEPNTYLKGFAEVVGELRRRVLDELLHGYSDDVDKMLNYMDDIYSVLVSMDYPDAVTNGLRRLTDVSRSIIERTRGDVTMSYRQEQLEKRLKEVEETLKN
jgi:translin